MIFFFFLLLFWEISQNGRNKLEDRVEITLNTEDEGDRMKRFKIILSDDFQ